MSAYILLRLNYMPNSFSILEQGRFNDFPTVAIRILSERFELLQIFVVILCWSSFFWKLERTASGRSHIHMCVYGWAYRKTSVIHIVNFRYWIVLPALMKHHNLLCSVHCPRRDTSAMYWHISQAVMLFKRHGFRLRSRKWGKYCSFIF